MRQVYGGHHLPDEMHRELVLADRLGDWADDSIDSVEHFLDPRMSAELLLGEHEVVANHDLEHTAAGRDDGHILDVMLEPAENRLNHAHGTVSEASRGAVLN